ncbi:MAG: hypothetical protein K8R60_08260 [Burkholderiales bacterium]|nr:hypothetical protein [Burkholderiales bacterium]
MKTRSLILAAAAAAALQQASAAPVEGTITLDGKPIAATHVLAKLHDNAEGVVGRPLLVAVTDRPIPPGGLDGIGETVAAQMALAGKLRGLLFRIDPARPDEASMIVLDKPREAGRGLGSLVIGSKEQPAVTRLKIGADAVTVAFARPPGGAQAVDVSFALKVTAPLTREPPITADIKGRPAIEASPQYRASLAYGEAMRTGDVRAQVRLGSRAMNERMDMYPDRVAITERLKEVGAVAKSQLAKVHRIVVRGDRAALLIDQRAWITMVRENGEWKSGD